jgi:hypothetical protein
VRSRRATWQPRSRKATLRQLAEQEEIPPAFRPKNNLEWLRWAKAHPAISVQPDPAKEMGGLLQRERSDDLERVKDQFRALGRTNPTALGDLYKANAEIVAAEQARQRSESATATSGTTPKGKNERRTSRQRHRPVP